MLRLALIVTIFTTLIAGVAANAQSDGGYSPRNGADRRLRIFSIRTI
jgi:hypothetical protein